MTFDTITDSVSKALGHGLAIPVALVAILVLNIAAGVDVTNFTISVVSLVFLLILQHTQNRDGLAIQAKLDEIVRAVPEAEDHFIGLDRKTEKEIEEKRDV